MHIKEWYKMRQDHAFHRNLVFIVKVAQVCIRMLSREVKYMD